MLVRGHRFHGHNSLDFAYRSGRVVRGPELSLRWAANPRRKTWRAAVVVSRKVSKSAVTRNRIRRRIFEIVRLSSPPITGPYDLIFSVFDEKLATIEAAELQQLVSRQLQKAGVLATAPAKGRGIVGTEGKNS